MKNRDHPQRYRKRPVVIDAIRWVGENWDEVCDFIPVPEVAQLEDFPREKQMDLHIITLEGVMDCHLGDYIVKGVEGEYYPVKASIFNATYEPA